MPWRAKKEKPDKERMGLVAERIWRGAELRIMEDVVRRIKKKPARSHQRQTTRSTA